MKTPPLKRLGYIALLMLILLQAGGLMLVYHAQQCYVRHQMAEFMERNSDSFTELELGAAEYQGSRVGENEIYLRGKMYDVHAVHVNGDKVKLYVVNDIKEETVLKKIKGLNDGKSRALLEHLLKLFSQVYTSPTATGYQYYFCSANQPDYHTYKERLESLPKSTFSPPPRVS